MDMMSDMPMGSMSMGDGAPSLFTLQRMYWAVVGSAIGAATLVNILNRALAQHRYGHLMKNPSRPPPLTTMTSLRDSSLTPAKPKSLFFNTYATLTAIVREISYATLHPLTVGNYTIHFPPLGPVLIILANLITILVLSFYKLDTTDVWKWEDVGYSTGFMAICQLPLIFLLAGRQNIIGFLAGMSYTNLNWFHRWAARTLWLTATIHMCFWFRDWARYDYIKYELYNDELTKRGFAAWCILTFIVVTSIRPIRGLSYEVFVLQHVVTFVGFIVAVWMHAPNEVRIWVWIPIGLVVFDRVVRYVWGAYANLAVFHRNKSGKGSRVWNHSATFTPMPGNITRVTVDNPGIHWQAGQHVFLTCHTIVPLQSHPFTIASLPDDGKLEFFIRAENGGTRRFFRYASKNDKVLGVEPAAAAGGRTVFVEGPYGTIRSLRQFDSVVLLAGGMGATFTMPLLRDIISVWTKESNGQIGQGSFQAKRLAATKRIRFVWVIKSRAQLSLFETQLHSVLADVGECRLRQPDFQKELEISIYITCDEKLEAPTTAPPSLPPPPQALVTRDLDYSYEKGLSAEKDHISIHSISAESSSTAAGGSAVGKGCLPGGGCCCTTQIEDEDQINTCACTCSGPVQSEETIPTPNAVDEKPTHSKASSPSPSPTVLSGRPYPRTIIRKVLEKAEGESAVVVCGPPGLSDDVRRSVVYLSDERAVHKGTGAQGIYLHVENFGY
ncbi:metalloreductase [Penicillium brasilianum]|uniref:ferric-chelate reductase (NADPH) n=1 Tax=Penicillium brasilianum TaxID=104259 RepID=A0A1S9RIA5_PENBI|nr:metalloreductase [Penicillium brasilianum]